MSNELTERFLKAWNSSDIKQIGALYAADARMQHPMAAGPLMGRAAIEQFEGGMFAAFSSIEWSLVSLVRSGNDCALEFRCTAVNTAPMQTPNGAIPATNKRVDVRGVDVLRLNADGLVAESRRYMDAAAFMRQLGLA